MSPEEREIIRSNLHQIDLLLRSIRRKIKAEIEFAGAMQSDIKDIERHKVQIYDLLEAE